MPSLHYCAENSHIEIHFILLYYAYIVLFASYVSEFKLTKEKIPSVFIDYAREALDNPLEDDNDEDTPISTTVQFNGHILDEATIKRLAPQALKYFNLAKIALNKNRAILESEFSQ